MINSGIKKILNRFGYDILHLPTDPVVRRRMHLISKYSIDLIFDIGANTGQFAGNMRSLGYKGKIISFEPLPDAFIQLSQKAASDPLWEVVNLAIGDQDGETTIHISQNSYSSSILDILPAHLQSAPDSIYTDSVIVPIRKIDSIIDKYYKPEMNLFLKIDTQGYERHVFEGSINSLEKIKGFQMELSLIPLYVGETLMQEMIHLLSTHNFKLMLIEPGHQNYETGELLQVEGIFFNQK
jgi:FkbM family methyltransferase